MQALKLKRGTLKSSLTKLKNMVDGYTDTINQGIVDAHQKRLDGLWAELQKNHDEIIGECVDDDERDGHQRDFDEVDGKVIEIQSSLNNAMRPPSSSQTTSAQTHDPMTPHLSVNLPKLSIPTYSGEVHEWLGFSDMFCTMVHNNQTLQDVNRFQYLKLALRGDAARHLNSIPVTNANYQKAWSMLEARFSHERVMVFSHLDRLFDHHSMPAESATGLRKLIDNTNESVRALENLKRDTGHWDDILVYVTMQKLDPETRRRVELSLTDKKVPTFDQLMILLEQHSIALDTMSSKGKSMVTNNSPKKPFFKNDKNPAPGNAKSHVAATQDKSQCCFCSESHNVFQCSMFNGKSVPDRLQLAKEKKLCLNCLRSGHFLSSCPSTFVCRVCKQKHHSLLHQNTTTESAVVTNHTNKATEAASQVLLATAVVQANDRHGALQTCRVLLDSGSQASFITMACVNRLGLQREETSCKVTGIASSGGFTANSQVSIQVKSRFEESTFSVTALVLKQVTGDLPTFACSPNQWKHLNGLLLADPLFYKPQGVDILLGAEVLPEILRANMVRGEQPSPTAQETAFGWILYGPVSATRKPQVLSHVAHLNLDSSLQRFWEIEEVSESRNFTLEEKLCETHYADTHRRNPDGSYTVRLPFKGNIASLGNSYNAALRRFAQLERRLQSNSDFRSQYSKFMDEYRSMGHMELVSDNELEKDSNLCYYLPHHAIIKEDSTTTKLRVVFDASAKTTTGTSLNSLLMVGPTLQDDLFTILVRFRIHPIALKADLEKMFRFIHLDARDRDYFRIFWREKPSDPLQIYRLTTVTFGSACAPYQAVKTVRQLASDEMSNHPEASAIILRDLYVDDLMSGATSEEEAVKLQQDIVTVMSKGQLNIRKWSSNSRKLLESIPAELRETQLPLRLDPDEAVKTLGLKWHPGMDSFSFSVQPYAKEKLTKRTILSDIAKLFDPLGLLAPVTITAKIFMQQLWKVEIGWDETLPTQLSDSWLSFRKSLPLIQDLQIPRHIAAARAQTFQLHGFSDASEKAISAVVYLRTISPAQQISCNLVAAKTKVAPLKQVSLPRLELIGAVLLSKLVKSVERALPVTMNGIYGWTDSTVALQWIKSSPQRWKTFVANRVTEVQGNLAPAFWFHISGILNPADCASRGISPEELANHPLWWHGPAFLHELTWASPEGSFQSDEASIEERKVVSTNVAFSQPMQDILQRFSSLSKLKKYTALWVRFARSFTRQGQINISPLSSAEMDHALLLWIGYVQSQAFSLEVKCLTNGEPCPSKSKILSLSPFLDSQQVLRVGGRLRNSDLSYGQKHPILLPPHHHLTKLVFAHYHERLLHAGSQLLLQTVQQRFWVPRGKDMARSCVRKCIPCFRQNASTHQQLMGDLPKSRVIPSPPFNKCGVDYAGPFLLRQMKGRNPKIYKAYIAVFVCFATRAIHLELVSDLSTDAFLAALKRFVGRRSTPAEIHSDCGTNFVGAARELKEFLALVRSEDSNRKISSMLQRDGIVWLFNPPAAPHFGGLWEAGVKSTKHHLKRVLGSTALNYEEFSTLLIQIEACLNSRPICPLSTSPDEMSALTPGHFLTGRPLVAIAEPDYTLTRLNRLSRWQLLQQLCQHFWKRWQAEYLTRLQQRPKWAKVTENLGVNDMVLLKDDHLPPQKWRLGRIVEVHTGADGLVRVVSIRIADGIYRRPVTKVCKLPFDSAPSVPTTSADAPRSTESAVEKDISTRAGMLGQKLLSLYHAHSIPAQQQCSSSRSPARASADSLCNALGLVYGFGGSTPLPHGSNTNGQRGIPPRLASNLQSNRGSQHAETESGSRQLLE